MKEVGLYLLNMPEEPKIPLENYLLKLVDKKDRIGNSLYLYDVQNLIKEIWNELKSKIIITKFLPKKLKIQPSPFYSILKGKRGISIQQLHKLLFLWKEYCSKDEEELEGKWNQIFYSNFLIASFSKPQKVTLPKYLTPKLAYLIGWIVGDGCFDCASNKERFKINDKNKQQLEMILKPIFKEIFGIRCYVRKDNPGPCLRIFSKPVYRFFRNILKLKIGKIPKWINILDELNKSFFIRGLFDSERDINSNYLESRIRINQNSKKFLKELISIMKSIDVSANGPYGPYFGGKNGVCYNIEVRKKSEILKFKQKIGTSHLEKK